MTPKTVAIGAVLALAGVLLGMNFPIAEAQRVDGPYALTGGGAPAVVWRMNQRTGQVSLCVLEKPKEIIRKTSEPRAVDITKTSEPRAVDITPRCSAWGPATEH